MALPNDESWNLFHDDDYSWWLATAIILKMFGAQGVLRDCERFLARDLDGIQ